jgi:hypothetical protein
MMTIGLFLYCIFSLFIFHILFDYIFIIHALNFVFNRFHYWMLCIWDQNYDSCSSAGQVIFKQYFMQNYVHFMFSSVLMKWRTHTNTHSAKASKLFFINIVIFYFSRFHILSNFLWTNHFFLPTLKLNTTVDGQPLS